ncbi:polyadenylate-specific 3'-exoribonuclease AS [Frankia sp. R82]|uniref:polyadenylate-specific 3'-exoribonuclease AS n=1 Tax=Frankia sp. R82 TaxID=2950553 RepID=UPI002043A935|nr:polyadenylate-specific 3'-exoribonuclease AS [Frankia sp. R82]MCM3885870.1 polyadenylate-specific 3'-exoribonuclease AS [Frankia sp. R82]
MATRFFYDTEFIERRESGHLWLDLVSIGIVSEDGARRYYAVSTEFDPVWAVPWVRRNVLDQLPSPADPAWRSRARIRDDLTELLTADGAPELWAWYGAYDHVVLCQLFGTMTDLPAQLPRFTRDLRQLWEELGRPALPPPPANAHDALADALHNLARWEILAPLRPRTARPSPPS